MPTTRTTIKTIDTIDTLKDHDILIALVTKFDAMALDIKELKDGTSAQLVRNTDRIDKLEQSRDELQSSLRTLKWLGGVILAVGGLLIAIFSGVLRVLVR